MGAWTSSALLLHRAQISSRTPALALQTRSLISVSSAPSNTHAAGGPDGDLHRGGDGLYDLHNNVWQWVQDCYASSYSGLTTEGSVYEPISRSHRVLRSGCWGDFPGLLRSV